MAKLSRRRLLIALGWGAAGITVAAGGATWALMPVLPPRNAPVPADAAAWISLRPDGTYELLSSRAEMGQGISVGLRQVAAAELGVDISRVSLVQPDTALIPVARATVGSDAMRESGVLVAKAAAALAGAIVNEAARRLGRPVTGLSLTAEGVSENGSMLITLAEIGAGPPLLATADAVEAAVPRLLSGRGGESEVGRPHPTHDIDAIVTGSRPVYTDDIRLPGMVFGAVIRPDRLGGRIVSIDAAACRDSPGFLGLYRDGDFAGIVASRRGALAQAYDLLAIEEADGLSTSSADIAAAVDVGGKTGSFEHTILDTGDFGGGDFDIDLTLTVPLAAHASIESRTAVARFDADGGLEVWTGTQDPFFVRDTLANAFGLARETVVVHAMRIGGGFGARTIVAAEMEAARLARLCGRPVKLQWSRRDEFRAGFHRPPSSHRIRLSADAGGRITRWHHGFRSGHVIFTSAAMGPGLQFATSFIADPGSARGAIPAYRAEAMRVEFDDVRLPVKTGPWRGLGAAPNHWAVETSVDALARVKGIDPLDLRLGTIAPQHERLKAVLEAVADMSGWRDRRDDASEDGFGLACGIYKEMSYAAAVARVTRHGDGFRVTKLWCAHDCGLVINPDQVRAQIEGNLVWGIGMALTEELPVADGRIAAESFFDYRLPAFSEVPEIEIRLVDSREAPSGAGETAIVCATAAITNAIAALTGETVRALPVRGL